MARKTILVLALVLSGCATSGDPEPASYDERLAAMMRPFEELKRQKADLWRLGYEPQVFDFEGQGRVTVRRWQLAGWPGEVYVQARITFENTTDHPVSEAFVWLDVLDKDEQPAGSTAVRLVNPMGYAFWPGHTYSTEIRTATNGAHLDGDGWSWTVACETIPETDPGTKPVIIDPTDPPRGWWLYEGSTSRPIEYRTTRVFGSYRGPQHVPGENR